MISNRVKVAFIAPCIGHGGADALMQGLIKYAHHLDFTGIAVSGEISLQNIRWYEKCLNWGVPIHQQKMTYTYPGVNYYDNWGHAVYNAVKDANIIVTWSQPGLSNVLQSIDLPVIEYAQNTDIKSIQVCHENEPFVHYKAACSKAATACFPDKDGVRVIYNGIDPGRVAPRKGRHLQRKAWGIPEDKKVILFMGRLVEEKNPDAVIQALQHLDNSWIGLFVGEGQKQPELFKLAKKLVPNRTAFVRPEYHIGDALAASDVFILPSDYEGHPLALMEAMFSGIPTVYTDFTVMKELHEMCGELGVMVPMKSDGIVFATAIEEATSETEMSLERISRAREVVWQNFTLPTVSHAWEEYIEWCLFDYYRRKRYSVIYPASE